MNEKNEKDLAIIGKIEKIAIEAKKTLLVRTIKSEKDLDALIETYSNVEIKDKASYDFKVKGVKEMKKINSLIESNRKDITAPFVAFQKDLIEAVKPWKQKLETCYKANEIKIKKFEDIEKAKAEQIMADRCQQLTKNGYSFVAGNYQAGPINLSLKQIEKFTEDDFKLHVQLGKDEKQRVEAEEQRKLAEAEKTKKDREKLDKEKADFLKEKAEFEKQKTEFQKDKKLVDEKIGKINEPSAAETKEKIDEKFPPEEKTEAKTEEKPVETPKTEAPKKIIKNKELKIKYFMKGFDSFRDDLIDGMLDDENKKSREEWIKWATNLVPTKK